MPGSSVKALVEAGNKNSFCYNRIRLCKTGRGTFRFRSPFQLNEKAPLTKQMNSIHYFKYFFSLYATA